jgi:hypothetical protein
MADELSLLGKGTRKTNPYGVVIEMIAITLTESCHLSAYLYEGGNRQAEVLKP